MEYIPFADQMNLIIAGVLLLQEENKVQNPDFIPTIYIPNSDTIRHTFVDAFKSY